MTIRGFTHVSLSVSDLEVSAEWYQRVLGLETLVPPFERLDYRETLLSIGGGKMALCLQAHQSNAGTEFDENRTGLDHIAFYVASLDEYETLLRKLESHGVNYDRQTDGDFGPMAVFRDPDNIQLELHCPRSPSPVN